MLSYVDYIFHVSTNSFSNHILCLNTFYGQPQTDKGATGDRYRTKFTEFGTWSSADKFIAPPGGGWLITTYTQSHFSLPLALLRDYPTNAVAQNCFLASCLFLLPHLLLVLTYGLRGGIITSGQSHQMKFLCKLCTCTIPAAHVWIALSRCAKNLYKSHCVSFITFVWYIAHVWIDFGAVAVCRRRHIWYSGCPCIVWATPKFDVTM